MIKIKAFFVGILLLLATFAMVVLVAVIYRANERMSIKSYIFQINNFASQRVGALQKLDDMSAVELRNRLIKKYVSEYFTVIPNEENVSVRPDLRILSEGTAYQQWESGEAVKIADMSRNKMFRTVEVIDTDIATVNMPEGYDYYNAIEAQSIIYEVRFTTKTWSESNAMQISPTYDSGTVYIEARFKPGIIQDVNVRKYLESGENPLVLFMFKVSNVNYKE